MRIRLVIAALAIPAALLSACGGDDGGDAGNPEASSASDTPSESAIDTPSEPPTDEPTDQPSDQPTDTEDPSADWPPCTSVWRDGSRLPRGYEGCREGDTGVPADARGCSFGRPLVIYANRFYAVPSGVIHETSGRLAKDRGYRSAMASCTA
jgi:hypothetical protein